MTSPGDSAGTPGKGWHPEFRSRERRRCNGGGCTGVTGNQPPGRKPPGFVTPGYRAALHPGWPGGGPVRLQLLLGRRRRHRSGDPRLPGRDHGRRPRQLEHPGHPRAHRGDQRLGADGERVHRQRRQRHRLLDALHALEQLERFFPVHRDGLRSGRRDHDAPRPGQRIHGRHGPGERHEHTRLRRPRRGRLHPDLRHDDARHPQLRRRRDGAVHAAAQGPDRLQLGDHGGHGGVDQLCRPGRRDHHPPRSAR
jgi:hypothetical protein